jgi:molybdopterin molybdotransferase
MTDTLSHQTPQASRQHMLDHVDALETQTAALGACLGATLRQAIIAPFDQPPFAASAMDGYALASAATPGDFRVVGTSAAGLAADIALQAGEAMRIFTGAPLPIGADCVVIQEDVTRQGDVVTTPKSSLNKNVRGQGIDFKIGQTLLQSGIAIDPIKAALIAATGLDRVFVSRRPRVSILTGGDEIVAPGQARGPHQIYDSITTGLASLIQNWGGEAQAFAPQRDDIDHLQSGFAEAFDGADLVVTIGGASVGDKDLMKPALAAFAPTFLVDKVAVRPGKPVWFATTDHGPVLGLPGNPASALVCAYLFLRPILAKMLSQIFDSESLFHAAKLVGPLPQNGPREHYVRGHRVLDRSGQIVVTPAEQQDSALLSVFAGANCLIRQAPNSGPLADGALVEIMPL